jgi:hypothetical protein
MSKREEMREEIKQMTNEGIMDLFRSKFITDEGKRWSKLVKTNPPDNPYPNGFNMYNVLSNAEDEFNYQWKDNWDVMEERLEEFKKDLEKEFHLS